MKSRHDKQRKGLDMMRMGIVVLMSAALMGPALAQAATVRVTYNYKKTFRPLAMNEAIDEALKNPAFTRQRKPGPDTLVLSVPQGWEYTDHRKKDHIRFMVIFTRNGDKIGESEEMCPIAPPYDCVDQITSDIKSAAAIAAH